MESLKPQDVGQAAEMISWAASERKTLEIVAGGSKRRLGRFAPADFLFDASAFAGIVDYEPAELVLTARPATPMKDIEAQLAMSGQMLSFEPPDWRALLGGQAERGPAEPLGEATTGSTLGGILACNLAGSRRVRAGAARDYFLGFSAINGRGEIYKAGGKVVKNVTGYDMCKLQAGAYGTLSLLTEVTIKTMPRPEAACTLLLPRLDDDSAIALLARALNTPHEVSAAAHLPATVAQRCGVSVGDGAVTALRVEGPVPSIVFRAGALEGMFGRGTRLDDAETAKFWAAIGQVHTLLPQGARCVWRVCPTPGAAPALLRLVRGKFGSAEAFYDWGGGLIWLSLDSTEAGADGGATFLRQTLRPFGGHAMLVVAPDELRGKAAVFEPEGDALATISQRIKNGFDPSGILNPGRMQEGR
jgi:glycolate oxidase FAD binding subunit